MPAPSYKHTQIGWVFVVLLAVLLAVCGAFVVHAAHVAVTAPLLVVLAIFALFSTLTVSVDGERLRARFGPGPLGKTVALADVKAYRAVTSPWYYGYGIRLTPYGWLYNVSGPHAVEIVLRDGARFRIGTDQLRAGGPRREAPLPVDRG